MHIVMKPGEWVCDLLGLEAGSDNRQILRMFLNTIFWGVVGATAAFQIATRWL